MGSMDRNTVIGFVLLAVLLFLYLFMSTKSSQELALQKKQQEDSIAAVKRVQDSIRIASDTTATITTGDTSAHRKLSPRSSIFELKKLYKAKKIGICNRAGIHPPKGFTPASRKSFICSTPICCWSLPYFAFNWSISGLKAFIFAPLR